jgi:hypothetical protein
MMMATITVAAPEEGDEGEQQEQGGNGLDDFHQAHGDDGIGVM